MICPACDGDKMCHRCWNQGTVPDPNPPPGNVGGTVQCGSCGGKKQCSGCGGSGTTGDPRRSK